MFLETATVAFLTGSLPTLTKAVLDRRQRKTVNQLRQDVDDLTKRVAELTRELANRDVTISVLTGDIERRDADIALLQADKEALRVQLSKCDRERRAATRARDAALRQFSCIAGALDRLAPK